MSTLTTQVSPERLNTTIDPFNIPSNSILIHSSPSPLKRKPFTIFDNSKDNYISNNNKLNNKNSIPFIQKLQHSNKENHMIKNKSSKLDILDSKLTSFPLAPPPPKKDVSIYRSPEFNAIDDPNTTLGSLVQEVDPIVLVEDYIQRQRLARKKLSVLDLKISMKNCEPQDSIHEEEESSIIEESGQINYLRQCRSILSNSLRDSSSSRVISVSTCETKIDEPYLLTTNIIKEEENEEFDLMNFLPHELTPTEHTNLSMSINMESMLTFNTFKSSVYPTSIATLKLSDEIDQPIPEFSLNSNNNSLKYCIICETPLYEISSLLKPNDNFSEFVCCSCTEKYEALSKLVDDFDLKISKFETLPDDIEDIEEALNYRNSRRIINSTFSKNLINKLQGQLNGESVNNDALNNKQQQWLQEAKRKLRWRWRISGLLPNFLGTNIVDEIGL